MADHISSSEDEAERTVSHTFDFTKKTWKDDVAFLVEGRKLFASKSILALVSPVFESMFGSQFAEKFQHEVPLPGKKFDEFHEFLQCIYPTSQRLVSELNVNWLLPLADEYQVKSLVKRCNKFLNAYLLAKDDLSTSYFMKCYEMASRYRLNDIKSLCAAILAEKEIGELEEAKSVLQEQETFVKLQSDIISKQGKEREERRTELVKICMNMDMNKNLLTSNIRGFELAKGATIELKPSVEALLQKQPQYSVPVRIWDLYFQLQIALHLKHDGEQSLKFKLKCTFPNDGVAWVCETKTRLCLKNQYDIPSASNICHNLNRSFLCRESDHAVGFQTLSPILKNDSGFVKKDKLHIIVHFFANKPYVEYSQQLLDQQQRR